MAAAGRSNGMHLSCSCFTPEMHSHSTLAWATHVLMARGCALSYGSLSRCRESSMSSKHTSDTKIWFLNACDANVRSTNEAGDATSSRSSARAKILTSASKRKAAALGKS